MGLFSNPKIPYFVRIAQLLLSIGFLVLISYAGAHRGWWKGINGALAVGGKYSCSEVFEGPCQVVVLNGV